MTLGDVLAQIGTTMRFQHIHERPPLDKLVEASFEDEMDRALMKQRYTGAQISLCANSDEPRVEIVPSCGFLHGDVTGPSLFNDVYSEHIAIWKRHCEKRIKTRNICMPKCFFTSDIYDASSTVFADDITKRTVTNTPQEVITKMEETSRMLRKFAADIGIVMNRSKEERQVGFVGPGSVTSMRMLHREGKWPDSMGKSCPTQRVLGTLLTYNCGNVAERQARLRAAQAGWTAMGRFWSVPSESNVLFSAAWSGRHS